VTVLLLWAISDAARKHLFEYDHHFVMLNDIDRNEFYRQALMDVMPDCPACTVLDLGAGSGLLSLIAAKAGASHVTALEVNPDLAALAETVIAQNGRPNITVIAELSTRVKELPAGQVDIMITETFGTLMLAEGALNFIPKARDQFLKPGGIIIPSGGCQYVTLVASELGDVFNTEFDLRDTIYFSSSLHGSNFKLEPLAPRVCILPIDWTTDSELKTKHSSFEITIEKAGKVAGLVMDWDIWMKNSSRLLSTSFLRKKNFASEVAWGTSFQPLDPLDVAPGDVLELQVETIANGITFHFNLRRTPTGEPVTVPEYLKVNNHDMLMEINSYTLPMDNDMNRRKFYSTAATKDGFLIDTVLGHAASEWKNSSLIIESNRAFQQALEGKEVWSPSDISTLNVLEPDLSARVVALEVPGTLLTGKDPFLLFRKLKHWNLLAEDVEIIPEKVCFEVGLVESEDLLSLHSVPGFWNGIDFREWNREGRRQTKLKTDRAEIPHIIHEYNKYFHPRLASMKHRWIAQPRCVFTTDWFSTSRERKVIFNPEKGKVHAIVGRWKGVHKNQELTADDRYIGRGMWWAHYVQMVDMADKNAKLRGEPLIPLEVKEGASVEMSISLVKRGVQQRAETIGQSCVSFCAEEGLPVDEKPKFTFEIVAMNENDDLHLNGLNEDGTGRFEL